MVKSLGLLCLFGDQVLFLHGPALSQALDLTKAGLVAQISLVEKTWKSVLAQMALSPTVLS